ncbi:cation:proton antiporter [Actinosynnema sp. ALI-1.44]|uniref:cation:proton antiporter n=1 Tax=Actinosynnema sp. ALI-1.44 TaxID=1933779 RepID=UPI001EDA844D|nr:cation:proton antiporter [Actinosynnema sp. ALI-1.44]
MLIAHVVAAVAALLSLAYLARRAAVCTRQPAVMAEIAIGLLLTPVLIALVGREGFTVLLPGAVVDGLRSLGQVGLALFLVGVAHELGDSVRGKRTRSLGWVIFGALVPAFAAGTLAACGIAWTGDPALRGTAPLAAFVLLMGVALAITAVPVLARILLDRGINGTPSGRVALSAAVLTDAVAWPVLAVAVGLTSGSLTRAAVALITLLAGVAAALGLRRLLRTGLANRVFAWLPGGTALVLAAAALGAASLAERLGLHLVCGAFLVGLAIPTGDAAEPWARPVRWVYTVGRWLVAVYFVVAGVTLFARPLGTTPWLATLVATLVVTVLAVVSKIGGGYAGARLAGHPRRSAAEIGVLLNTRGLTEVVVLQIGLSVGILTPLLFLACLVMALVTTSLTGPALSFIDHRAARQGATAGPGPRR